MNPHIFLMAGEKSGDLLGSNLIQSLKERIPHVKLSGVAGTEMRSQGIECFLRMEEFEVMGFTDILKAYPRLRKRFFQVKDYILKNQPQAVILIDYPGFNLRMAKALRDAGYKGKIIQYTSPTVWAWGKNRIKKMAETLDLLLTIYPFESDYFKNTSLKVKYVGNPIKENVTNHYYKNNWNHLFGVINTDNLVALFPGSRKSEIQLNLPYQLQAAEMIKKDNPESLFAISCAHEEIVPVMHRILKMNTLQLNRDLFLIPKTYAYELMRDCKSAIAKSGTVTLELALHERPTVVMYKVSPINRFIAKYIFRLKLPFYCIVNILSGESVFPELIEKGLSGKNIYRQLKALNREKCAMQCQKLHEILKENKASENAADAVVELLA